MARKKVEICGVNTSSLPLLSEEEKEEECFRGAVGLRLWPGGFVAQSHHADRSLRRYFPSLAYLAFGNDRCYRLWRMGHLHLS